MRPGAAETSRRRRWITAGVLLGLAAAVTIGVASVDSSRTPIRSVIAMVSPSPTPTPTPTPAATPTPTPPATVTPPPTPTRDDSALQPGTNHNWTAGAYTYRAADVHDWIHGAGVASPSYPSKKIAFLTFDDGPTNTTPKVLQTLDRLDVPASFFVIAGPQGLGRPGSQDYLRQEIAQGHSVCIHSYSHNYDELYPNRTVDPAAIVADHDRAVAAIREVLGPEFQAHCMRYPGGHGWDGASAGSDPLLEAQGVYWFDWNLDNADGKKDDPGTGPGRADRVISELDEAPNVVVVLMHDFRGNQATVDSIEPVVNALRARGYEFGVLD